MVIIFTPGQLARRSDFYYQLGQLTGAGLGVVAALKQIQRSPPERSYREPIGRLLGELEGGHTFGEALIKVEGWLPEFDTALLHAGEQSGRLEECFRLLREYYQERAQLARQLLSGMAYPVFLLHFAMLIMPFPTLFRTGDLRGYLWSVFGVLLPLYAIVGVMVYASQSGHGLGWRSRLKCFCGRYPCWERPGITWRSRVSQRRWRPC